jgi:hypothetical protein
VLAPELPSLGLLDQISMNVTDASDARKMAAPVIDKPFDDSHCLL